MPQRENCRASSGLRREPTGRGKEITSVGILKQLLVASDGGEEKKEIPGKMQLPRVKVIPARWKALYGEGFQKEPAVSQPATQDSEVLGSRQGDVATEGEETERRPKKRTSDHGSENNRGCCEAAR